MKMMIMMIVISMMKVVVELHEHMDHYIYTFYNIAFKNRVLKRRKVCKVVSPNKIVLCFRLTIAIELIYLVQLHYLIKKNSEMCNDFSKHVLSLN